MCAVCILWGINVFVSGFCGFRVSFWGFLNGFFLWLGFWFWFSKRGRWESLSEVRYFGFSGGSGLVWVVGVVPPWWFSAF